MRDRIMSLLPKVYDCLEVATKRYLEGDESISLKDITKLYGELMDRGYGKPRGVLDVLYEQKVTTGTIDLSALTDDQLKQVLSFQAGGPEARSALVRAMSGEASR